MGGFSYKKNEERGLWFEIKCIEEDLQEPSLSDGYRKFLKSLLRSYKKYSEESYKVGVDARNKSNSV